MLEYRTYTVRVSLVDPQTTVTFALPLELDKLYNQI